MTKQTASINMTESSNLFLINNISQHVIPSIMVCHNNRLPLLEVRAKTVMQQHATLTNGKREENTKQHVAFTGGTRKTVTKQRVAFTGGTRKTATQQHVAFTGGKRKIVT